jgi:hypothetical protein
MGHGACGMADAPRRLVEARVGLIGGGEGEGVAKALSAAGWTRGAVLPFAFPFPFPFAFAFPPSSCCREWRGCSW